MATPTLLLVDNALDHSLYRPRDHWERLAGGSLAVVRPPLGEALPEPGLHTHVILSGSEASIVERAAWAEAELRWVRRAAAAGVRLLGSCWGHQLIAAALGGPRCVRRALTPEVGWVAITVRDEGLLPPGELWSFASHFDEVVPGSHPDLHVLAGNPACAVQALRWADLPVWGVQPHPEISLPEGEAFLRTTLHRWPNLATICAAALAGPRRDSEAGAALLPRFLAA